MSKSSKKKTVLIVDDDISVSEYLDVAIKSAGHKTVLARDGEEALNCFQEHKPDLVLLDALIPRRDGFEVCRRIKNHSAGRRTPVVMMTGIYTKRSYRQQALGKAGAAEYIVKPLGISEVWRVLQTHLGVDPGKPPPEIDDSITERMAGEKEVSSLLQEFFEQGNMTLEEGTPFSEKPLAITLRELYARRATGLLFLRSEKRTSIFYLEAGRLVFVRSNEVELRLDRVLVKMNKISEAEYEKAQELFKAHRGRRRMGEILTGCGIISDQDLHEALKFQLQLLVARVFRWKEGTAYFVEGDLPSQEDAVARFDIRSVIFAGVKNMRDREAILRCLPKEHAVLKRNPWGDQVLEKIGVTAFERQILSTVDGTKTLRQVRSMGLLANVDIDALLFAFLCTGLVEEDRVNTEILEGSLQEEKEPAGKRRAFKGNLRDRPMAQLLHTLYRHRKTGVLTVERGGSRKFLQIERGEVIFAGSDDPEDRIGRVLVRANLVCEEELDKALEASDHRGGKRIGRVLVDSGHITLEELYWAVVFQVQRIVLSLFSWPQGEYLFREGPLPTREAITLELNTPSLIMEGVRSMPRDLLEDRMPPADALLRRTSRWKERSGPLGLDSSETIIIEAFHEPMTVVDLMESSLAPAGVLEKSIFAFINLGLLKVELPETAADTMARPAEVEVGEEVAAAGGSPAGVVARPSGHAAPPANPPIPFPSKEPPATAGRAEPGDGQQVPRFLYDELLGERRELEDQILELHAENCGLRARLTRAAAQLEEILEGKNRRISKKALQGILDSLQDRD